MVPGDHDALGHPQQLCHAYHESSASTTYVHQMLNHGEYSKYHYCSSKLTWRMFMFIYYFSNTNRFEMVPGWSICPQTPSTTLSTSTIAISASTSYVHENLTWYMFIYCLLSHPWQRIRGSHNVAIISTNTWRKNFKYYQ